MIELVLKIITILYMICSVFLEKSAWNCQALLLLFTGGACVVP